MCSLIENVVSIFVVDDTLDMGLATPKACMDTVIFCWTIAIEFNEQRLHDFLVLVSNSD